MTKQPGHNRIWISALLVLLAATASHCGYFGSFHLGGSTHQVAAAVFGTTLFLSIALGPFYVYLAAYLSGAALWLRVLAASLTPFVWMTKEVFRLWESHPLFESLYWYFNPLNIWLICLMVMEMALATLVARAIRRRRGHMVPASPLVPVLISTASLLLVVCLYAWGKGENVYVLFLEGYRFFFDAGI